MADDEGAQAATDSESGSLHLLTKEEFGKKLYRLMTKRGWRQSELGRRSGIQRSNINNYINGRALPTDANVRRMAQALGVDPNELLPNRTGNPLADDEPRIEMRISPRDHKKAHLRVNMWVKAETAARIVALVQESAVDGD